MVALLNVFVEIMLKKIKDSRYIIYLIYKYFVTFNELNASLMKKLLISLKKTLNDHPYFVCEDKYYKQFCFIFLFYKFSSNLVY